MPFTQLKKFFATPSLSLSREEALKIFRRDHFRCCYCGLDGQRDFCNWLILTVDHVRPQAKGGPRVMNNLVTACQPCNLIKGKRVFKSLAEARQYVLTKREEWRRVFQDQVKAAHRV